MTTKDDRSAAFSAHLRDTVEAALENRGISARQASIDVVGHDGLIRDIRSGRIPSGDRIQALAEYLGLEFYVGEPRILTDSGQPMTDEYFAIPRYDVQLAAGAGRENEEQSPMSSVALRLDWLLSLGVKPESAVILEVAGDSMEPALMSGDLVLVNRGFANFKDNAIYAFVDTDGAAKVKRMARNDGQFVIYSDNRNYAAEVRSADEAVEFQIIGQVVWSGHRH